MFGFDTNKEPIKIILKYKFSHVNTGEFSGETRYYIVDKKDNIYRYMCGNNPHKIYKWYSLYIGSPYTFDSNELWKVDKK